MNYYWWMQPLTEPSMCPIHYSWLANMGWLSTICLLVSQWLAMEELSSINNNHYWESIIIRIQWIAVVITIINHYWSKPIINHEPLTSAIINQSFTSYQPGSNQLWTSKQNPLRLIHSCPCRRRPWTTTDQPTTHHFINLVNHSTSYKLTPIESWLSNSSSIVKHNQ